MPEPTDSPKTFEWILTATTRYFAAHGADAPRATAEHLVARLLRCKRSELVPWLQKTVPDSWLEAMRRGMQRIASGEPLQYVIGQWDFRDFTLKTDARALIPRPETEQLVELALQSRRLRATPQPRLIDWGTGSGCIAIALARALPAARVIAIDVSPDALALAKENAAALGVADRILFFDLSQGIDLGDFLDPATIDAIVSNPPYIPTAVCEQLDAKVARHEPRLALDGGPDGMDILRQIADDALMLLVPGGELFFELDAESRQAKSMADYLAEAGYSDIRPHRDYAGAERFLSAVLPEGV